MALITFISDFGTRDHYVAAVKAKIAIHNPQLRVIDISHDIEPFNLAHGAFVLGSVFRDFPSGTVHIVGVHAPGNVQERFIAVRLEEHYFIGNDNGIFALISDKSPAVIVELVYDSNLAGSFPEKNIFAPAAAALANGKAIYDMGRQVMELNKMHFRSVRQTKNNIQGHVIHVDNYGNAITNIKREDFERFRNGRSFKIYFSRETVDHIQTSYSSEIDEGNPILIFNSSGYLEIGLKKAHAGKLLGLRYDAPVQIEFTPDI